MGDFSDLAFADGGIVVGGKRRRVRRVRRARGDGMDAWGEGLDAWGEGYYRPRTMPKRNKAHPGPNNLAKAKQAFVKSLTNKGYTLKDAENLFSLEEKKRRRIKNTRGYQIKPSMTEYQAFVKKYRQQGKSMKQCAALWQKYKHSKSY
jgi:hypothetical protein